MAWSTSNRKQQLPPGWENTIRPRILRRDRHRCRWIREDTGEPCNDRANQVDHVDQARSWDHSDANLQSLCEYHHGRKSSAEGGRAASARRKSRRRHPGML